MTRVNAQDVKKAFGDALNRVAYAKETIILQRRGEDIAALVPLEDLKLLERLREEEEDRLDNAAADAALAEPGENIPHEVIKAELGL
jgi:antitoxin Phd